MTRRYDPAWVTGVLRDVADFLAENDMPDSARSVTLALDAIRRERLQAAGTGNLHAMPGAGDPDPGNVVRFPQVARR